MRLTDAAIRALPIPEKGQKTYYDDLTGFALRVSQGATKTFVVILGRRWKTIGRYNPPHLTLNKARDTARQLLAHHQGNHPPIIFSDAFEEYRTRHLPRIRTAYEQTRVLRVRFEPHLGHRKLEDLTARDIAPIVDRIPTPYSSRAAFVAMRAFLNWCVRQEYLDRSPIERLRPVKRPESRDRVLSDDELRRLWHATADDSTYSAIVRLLILSGQRRSQFGNFKPSYLQGDLLVWPPEAMKAGKRQTLPLTPAIADLLPRVVDVNFRQWSPAKRKLDVATGIDFKLHDLRRVWATIAVENLDVPPHIADAVLAHTVGNSVSRTYNRALYIQPMREALLKFEAYIASTC